MADEVCYYLPIIVSLLVRIAGVSPTMVSTWCRIETPYVSENVGYALEQLKLKGRTKGLDILVNIPGKSPLTSNKLADLRKLLQCYADRFEVGTAAYWRLIATWLFITLGLRPNNFAC